MSSQALPRYPIYMPSKSRYDSAWTVRALTKDGVPFKIVCEPQEREQYEALVGPKNVIVLPHNERGLIYARNWIKQYSISQGDVRHWQLDDNIEMFLRVYAGKRLPCEAGVALRVCEDFTDRYTNVGISGLNYSFFVRSGSNPTPPFYANGHVYSCSLINNALPYEWRTYLNDDTDYCLQVLSGGYCTILLNAFLIRKMQTMYVKGGNTGLYKQGDGRLKMARSLERLWPGVVETKRRFKRPQHVVKNQWRGFDTPLKLRDDYVPEHEANEYGMRVVQEREIRSDRIRKLVARPPKQ